MGNNLVGETWEIHERLKALEVREALREKREMEIDEKLDELLEQLRDTSSELSRYKGFVGGILFIISALVAFLKLTGIGIMDLFSAHTK